MRGRSYSYSPSPSPPPRSYGRRYRSPSPRGRYSRGKEAPTSLLVRNLRHDCRPEDLRVPFGRYGPIKDIYLPRDYHTGDPRGFGFVQFVDPADAADAKYEMDGYVLLGRELTVVFAEENRKKPSEMRARERLRALILLLCVLLGVGRMIASDPLHVILGLQCMEGLIHAARMIIHQGAVTHGQYHQEAGHMDDAHIDLALTQDPHMARGVGVEAHMVAAAAAALLDTLGDIFNDAVDQSHESRSVKYPLWCLDFLFLRSMKLPFNFLD
uniref:RRM domain-containing protein n=1 Tax=Chenopodium quinoa TaxID=63459 RepID=A0A803MN84_CHEQI